MTSRAHSHGPRKRPAGAHIDPEKLLGYVNFSGGSPDAGFQRALNTLWASLAAEGRPFAALHEVLQNQLKQLQGASPTFADSTQADAVLTLVFEECLPAYRRHHADLLFHVPEADFQHPFFVARVFEACLSQGGPWSERDRIVRGTLEQLNDFLGYRPLAVLENGRRMEPYPHERFRPVPLFIREAGVGAGRYHDLIERTIRFLTESPPDMLHEAHFDLARLDELALDVRAHDHLHPANKRTNYMFGEWDPHLIDGEGYYRRFVIRQIILDALLEWIEFAQGIPEEERLYDAAAVLCGTMMMASSISGWGPAAHDSNVTLTSLLPGVARQRDAFYARLLENATGSRAARLYREAERTQQPFGHVRQHLNMLLAKYGARQVEYRFLAHLYARLGYPEAAGEQAAVIPSLSSRFETEIIQRITTAQLNLDRGALHEAAERIGKTRDLIDRGINCGALVDPWNILGFQGQFPLFASREDAVPDHRVEELLNIMEALFAVWSRALGEAAAHGDAALGERLSPGFREFAERWDRYATTTVADLPRVSGRDSYDSAREVARALAEWRAGGEAAGDISFWRKHVERFHSAAAYGMVADSLLRKRDHVAAMGLLMQWLSQADEVGLDAGGHSIHALLMRWLVTLLDEPHDGAGAESSDRSGKRDATAASSWPQVRRLFDFLEANAGSYWSVPAFEEIVGGGTRPPSGGAAAPGEGQPDDLLDEDEGDEEDDLFQAAYEGVVYRDSAADGFSGEVLDNGPDAGNTEFEQVAQQLEPRLRFLDMLANLWQVAAIGLGGDSTSAGDEAGGSPELAGRNDVLDAWRERTLQIRQELTVLMRTVAAHRIPASSGAPEANVEYDLQLQMKNYLLQTLVFTLVDLDEAERILRAALPARRVADGESENDRQLVALYRGLLRRDRAEVRRLLPATLANLRKTPLLYVPVENGGDPEAVVKARSLQASLRFLLTELPRLGLLRECWHVLRTAHRMERVSRPEGLAVTEFDRLFRTALENTLECVVLASRRWRGGKFPDEELIEIIGEIVERYLIPWLKHSDTMRLSTIEALDDDLWDRVTAFIRTYGGDLFHAGMLTLGNVRAILHAGVGSFLEYLAENQDPLHPVRLLDDIEAGRMDRAEAVDLLELIYGAIVDKFDRYLEYNSTTTQSDYGEMFDSLLDFLRLEGDYDREAWRMKPVGIAHEVLSRLDKRESALVWEHELAANSADLADEYLEDLRELEEYYGMRLPSLTDHLRERFVKPLAVNRMLALIPRAAEDAREERTPSPAFDALREEIDAYLEDTSGSSVDLPPWLRTLLEALERTEAETRHGEDQRTYDSRLPIVPVDLRDMRRQLKTWKDPLRRPKP